MESHKQQGIQAFRQQRYQDAIDSFTQAIQLAPNDHILFSNRSACYASLLNYEQALKDAQKSIQLKPDWPKGYARKGLAQFYLGQRLQASLTYLSGLQISQQDQSLQQGILLLKQSQSHQNLLFTIQNLQKLRKNSQTLSYLLDQDFIQLVNFIQNNPQIAQQASNDPRIIECANVILNSSNSEKSTQKVISRAEQLKIQGNKAYKQQKYSLALEYYQRALQIQPHQITYINNIAAVYLAQKNFQKCVQICDKAIQIGRKTHSDLKKIGRAFSRKALAFEKQGLLLQALECTKESLHQHFDDRVKFQLKNLQKKIAQQRKSAYKDPIIAQTHYQKGQILLKNQQFHKAVQQFTQALNRDPQSKKYLLSRASSYIKLVQPSKALSDLQKALQLDSSLIPAYLMKGKIHFLLKQYHNALDSYKTGLKIDPTNPQINQGFQKVLKALQESSVLDPLNFPINLQLLNAGI